MGLYRRSRARSGRREVSEQRFSVNGRSHHIDVREDETALDVVRDGLGLTGAKRVCEAGACGACALLVDGVPSASCLIPADALDGAAVTTVEGVADPSRLHPVQLALMAEDAVQCGYCTPGFVVSAVAFHDTWRREHDRGRPSVEEVRRALAGHLCRCGCYLRIVEAVRAACEGRYDSTDATPRRHEAREKVTGRARYTTDVRHPGQLEGVVVTSPVGNAVVHDIDDSTARSMPGVHAVVRLLADDGKVRYAGQEVLAVAADTLPLARAAAATVKIVCTGGPVVTGMDRARADDAPLVYGAEERGKAPSAGEVPVLFGRWTWRGNVRAPKPPVPGTRAARRGRQVRAVCAGPGADPRGGDAQTVSSVWTTSAQSHVPLEPHACVASWDDDGLTVHLSTQGVGMMAHAIARRWKLKSRQVRVLAEHVGGAFGAKQTLTAEAVAAVELSRATRRPVRVALGQRDELAIGGNRPGTETHLALAAGPTGDLRALSADAYAATGAAVGSEVAQLCGLLYPGPPRLLRDHSVLTHTPPGKPFRAPSGPPAFWALEQAIDEMAHRFGEDPLDLRRRWDTEPVRRRLYDWADEATPWRARGPVAVDTGPLRRGLGLATASWYYYLQPLTRVRAAVDDGGLVVSVALQEIGTGCRSVLVSVFADAFGLAPAEIRARIGDSRLPRGPLAAGSSTTASVVPAAHDAAARLKARVTSVVARDRGLTGARPTADGIRHAAGTIGWREALHAAAPVEVTGRRPRDAGPRPRPWYSPFFGRGRGTPSIVQVTEVEVDERYGLVRAVRTWCALAAGRPARPELATTQVHGAVIQSLGQTLYEERLVDPATGVTLPVSLENYAVPGIADVPEIEVAFLDGGFGHVPQQAVGIAELAALTTPASIGNAVFHATGRRLRSLPLRPGPLLERER
uniref:Oxidase n=1 Tax=Streptomyces melanovinaceus TaxID=1182637 RepID=A0A060NQN6_9ACTN|nr:oxidase [Streptomyces melanovinaceus]BAO84851.1 putative dehydrogenase [Streptomyces melanovinaceus]